MNITEANATSRLLSWLTGRAGVGGPISNERALADAEYLAERSRRALLAGITPEYVRTNWPGSSPATPDTTNGDQ